MVSSIYSQGG